MLTDVHINNFAIIDSINLELNAGMTALTGETGAGKSILIDALSLAMGDRAGKDVVRAGAKRAEISLTLDISRLPTLMQWLTDLELDDSENPHECLLRRTINQEGRSRAYINDHAVPLQRLRELTTQLVDIHGQHAHHLLLKPETHRYLLDLFGKHQALCAQVKTHYQGWKQAQDQLNDLKDNHAQAQSQLALLQFQIEELDELSPAEQEWQQLSQEQHRLSHAEQLISECQQAQQALEEQTALEKTVQLIQKLAHTDPQLNNVSSFLDNALIQVQEAQSELRHYASSLECDPQRLQQVEARMSKMHDLARKHRIEPETLPSFHQGLKDQLQICEDPDAQITQLQQCMDAHQKAYQTVAAQLSKKRQSAAKKLDKAITEHMKMLGMENGYFEVGLNALPTDILHEHGQEQIIFNVCTNPGQGAYPLHKVASGGELSRISLAIQVTTVQGDAIPIIVFDEVDVGIGGGTAEIVGRLLKQLGKQAQVLCVTHLAQVAAQADQHLNIAKTTDGQSTRTQITLLDEKARVNEIARMLGGVALTENTLAHAQEMLVTAEA